MAIRHVLVAGSIHADGLRLLEARADLTFEVLESVDPGPLAARLATADGLLLRTATVSAAAIAGAKRLRVVSRHGVGYDNVPLEALTARRVPLAVTADAPLHLRAQIPFANMPGHITTVSHKLPHGGFVFRDGQAA